MQSDVLAYTIADAVRISGSSRTVLYEENQEGRLPFRKLGRRTLVMRSDLEAWLARTPVVNGTKNGADDHGIAA